MVFLGWVYNQAPPYIHMTFMTGDLMAGVFVWLTSSCGMWVWFMSTPRRCGPGLPPFGSTGGSGHGHRGVHCMIAACSYLAASSQPSSSMVWDSSKVGDSRKLGVRLQRETSRPPVTPTHMALNPMIMVIYIGGLDLIPGNGEQPMIPMG
jgi:hypothetical protein